MFAVPFFFSLHCPKNDFLSENLTKVVEEKSVDLEYWKSENNCVIWIKSMKIIHEKSSNPLIS